MGVFDKFMNAIRINEDDYDEDEFYEEDEELDEEDTEEEEEVKPKKGLFSKLGKKSSKSRDEEDEMDEEDEDDFDDGYAMPAKKPSAPAPAPAQPRTYKEVPPAKSKPERNYQSKVTPLKKHGNGPMEVCVIKPNSMEDTREIADTLLSGCTVVLNLEGIDVDLAQRVIDFTSGSCYSIDGALQKISNYIFILTPSNVEISGDITDVLGGTSLRADY